MKTLILYATKYGTASEIVKRIARKIEGSVICDLKQGNIPPLDRFDCVIIGSPLYVGKIRKEVSNYIAGNMEALCKKTLGLFLTGLEPESTEAYFITNFPDKLLRSAKARAFVGGIYDPSKARVSDKFMMKMAKKPTDYVNTLNDEKIADFVETLKA